METQIRVPVFFNKKQYNNNSFFYILKYIQYAKHKAVSTYS